MDNNAFIGYLVIGLGSLIGLFLTVGKPIINLNTNLVKLNLMVEQLQKDYNKLKNDSHEEVMKLSNDNSDAHKRIHQKLDNHEERLIKLEIEKEK